MKPQYLIDYCMKKKGAYLDFPFGEGCPVLKVKGHIFAQVFLLEGTVCATLNCSKECGEFYRQAYPGVVVRGYHCPPVQQPYFDTFPLGGVADEVILEMADRSYCYVVGKLPKYIQAELRTERSDS